MAKAEISWKRRTDEGEKREVYVQKVGTQWKFFKRAKRYDQWAALPEPPLEDWMELLDAIERRIARRLLKPGEDVRLKILIQANYPETKF